MRDYVGPEVWGSVLTRTRVSGPGSVALDRDSRRFICTCRGLQGRETVLYCGSRRQARRVIAGAVQGGCEVTLVDVDRSIEVTDQAQGAAGTDK